jgi:hypothetical protein
MVPYGIHNQMFLSLPYLNIAKVGSNQPYNKIAFAKVVQVILIMFQHTPIIKWSKYIPLLFLKIYYMH